jgi:hypothetical protein
VVELGDGDGDVWFEDVRGARDIRHAGGCLWVVECRSALHAGNF